MQEQEVSEFGDLKKEEAFLKAFNAAVHKKVQALEKKHELEAQGKYVDVWGNVYPKKPPYYGKGVLDIDMPWDKKTVLHGSVVVSKYGFKHGVDSGRIASHNPDQGSRMELNYDESTGTFWAHAINVRDEKTLTEAGFCFTFEHRRYEAPNDECAVKLIVYATDPLVRARLAPLALQVIRKHRKNTSTSEDGT